MDNDYITTGEGHFKNISSSFCARMAGLQVLAYFLFSKEN
jgi:hypothetical protein